MSQTNGKSGRWDGLALQNPRNRRGALLRGVFGSQNPSVRQAVEQRQLAELSRHRVVLITGDGVHFGRIDTDSIEYSGDVIRFVLWDLPEHDADVDWGICFLVTIRLASGNIEIQTLYVAPRTHRPNEPDAFGEKIMSFTLPA